MARRSFDGFGDRDLRASEFGARHDPCIVIVPDCQPDADGWIATAEALAAAGRYVITLEALAGEEANLLVSDLNAVLRQLLSRPVILGSGLGAMAAIAVLGEGEPDLASGLVVTAHAPASSHSAVPDDAGALTRRAQAAAGAIRLDCLALGVRGDTPLGQVASALPGLERWDMESSADPVDDFNAALIAFLERQIPRAPMEYVAGSDPRTLRDALGTFATGVTVLTTSTPDGTPIGLTANSFTSVSLDPPLLLVCPARDAGSTRVIEQVEHFAVNVLHIGQQETSTLFATPGEDRFAQTQYDIWDSGVPVIRNSLASFECRKYAEYDGGDHIILVGEVLRVRYAPQRDPLLYFRGKYRKLHFA